MVIPAAAIADAEEKEEEEADGAVPAPQPLHRYHLIATPSDRYAMLAFADIANAAKLSAFAKTRGLLWSEHRAAAFVAGVAEREGALLELIEHRFPDLHRRLRVTMPGTERQVCVHAYYRDVHVICTCS